MTAFIRFTLIFSFLAFVMSAHADTLTKGEMDTLLKGEPVVRVTRDAQSKSFASGRAFAAIDIPVPPAMVFAALTDCERAKKFVKNLVSCKITSRDPNGLWEVRETQMRLSVALTDFRSVARMEYTRPTQIRFKQIEGTLDYAEGKWDLAPMRDGKATRVFYQVRAGTSIPVPEFVIQDLIKTDLPDTLKALRKEVLRGALAPR
jgi:ribosome-associated toxin RatA of RatAB toxin-antitoxin module